MASKEHYAIAQEFRSRASPVDASLEGLRSGFEACDFFWAAFSIMFNVLKDLDGCIPGRCKFV